RSQGIEKGMAHLTILSPIVNVDNDTQHLIRSHTMRHTFNLTRQLINAAFLLIAIVCAPRLILAQDIVIDWASSNDKPDSYPAQINRAQTFSVRVKNVNDILYTYTITQTSVPLSPDDFSNISRLVQTSFSSKSATPCAEALTKLQE